MGAIHTQTRHPLTGPPPTHRDTILNRDSLKTPQPGYALRFLLDSTWLEWTSSFLTQGGKWSWLDITITIASSRGRTLFKTAKFFFWVGEDVLSDRDVVRGEEDVHTIDVT